MRIIGGKFGGRTIIAPAGLPARPTTDYAKSGLFNVLSNQISFEDIKVLDLFAGLGGISMEFISRGAESVIAVDNNFKTIEFLKELRQKFGIKNLHPVRSDVFKYVQRCEEKFDLIFADPPFEMDGIEELIALITKSKLLKPNGIFILEHQSKKKFHEEAETRTYGNCSFTFFRGTTSH